MQKKVAKNWLFDSYYFLQKFSADNFVWVNLFAIFQQIRTYLFFAFYYLFANFKAKCGRNGWKKVFYKCVLVPWYLKQVMAGLPYIKNFFYTFKALKENGFNWT
jgi:hypothetical protein